jgi:hypothetical protein
VSDSTKRDLARGWLRAEKLLEEEADRLATMSDEDFEREMSALPDPAHVPTAEELLARGAELATKRAEGAGGGAASSAKVKTLPVRPRRAQWVMAFVAAAAVFALVIAGVVRKPDIVSAPSPGHEARAAKLREEAFAACDARQWRACEDKLGEARKLDRAGDADPRVQAAYKAAFDRLHADAGAP